jgi:septum formation protein
VALSVLEQPRLILASSSPRRRELLGLLGLSFEVRAADIDETVRSGEAPEAYVDRLAREKALAIRELESASDSADRFVLAADTAVVVEDAVLGKPGDDPELGAAMLKRLSGRIHRVLSGVAVARGRDVRSVVVSTVVEVRSLSEAEIRWYVASGEGRDKAGGYAVQGRAGAFVTAIRGSPTNVIGLPIPETESLLEAAGFVLPWSAR